MNVFQTVFQNFYAMICPKGERTHNMENLTLRDKLAMDRTLLANERTFLAYLRTFIGLIGTGFALWKLIDLFWARVISVFLLAAAPAVLAIGIYRYYKTGKDLKSVTESTHK